jgi:adenosylcobinamide-GDP ribazoletransferase
VLEPRVLHDLQVATLFLTRLPARPAAPLAMSDLARAVHLFPLVGAAVGAVGGLAYLAASLLRLPSLPAAIVAVAAMVVVTGALHEDGLADTADGLAGRDRATALEIMRDSRIGTYGTIALVLVLLARLMALAGLWDPVFVAATLIAAAAASRAAMPVVMWLQPSARDKGLAAAAGRPEAVRVTAGAGLAAIVAFVCLPAGTALAALLALALAAGAAAAFLGRRLGGCTGDTLGAVQQLGEVAFLMAIVARQ